METPLLVDPAPTTRPPTSEIAWHLRHRHRVAGWLPTICAVHCLLTPILVTTLPWIPTGHAFEAVLLSLTVLLAGALTASAWREHRVTLVWLPFVAGSLLWVAALLGWTTPVSEPVASAAGGLIIALGLYWNGRVRHRAVCYKACACTSERPGHA